MTFLSRFMIQFIRIQLRKVSWANKKFAFLILSTDDSGKLSPSLRYILCVNGTTGISKKSLLLEKLVSSPSHFIPIHHCKTNMTYKMVISKPKQSVWVRRTSLPSLRLTNFFFPLADLYFRVFRRVLCISRQRPPSHLVLPNKQKHRGHSRKKIDLPLCQTDSSII